MALERDHIEERPFWALTIQEIFEILRTSEDGLSREETDGRLKTFGKNIIPRGKRLTRLNIFLNQFKNPLIIVLIIAGLITIFLSHFTDSAFILFAVVVNAALGFYQENKSEIALSRLITYIKDRVRIIRDSSEMEIDAEEVVPGDVVRLMPGMRIPADLRLIRLNNLSVDESILTGESTPNLEKTIDKVEYASDIFDRRSMVFAGTLVNGGLGLGVAVATGSYTELGKIAALVEKGDDAKTPLQGAISKFTFRSSLILGFFTLMLFGLGIYIGEDIFKMFILSVAVAVGAVPEGLPVAMTVILAVGVERLARKNGIVRKLLAAETLGSTTVILTDKTGTLTEAKMALSKIMSSYPKEELLELALFNTDVVIENPESGPDGWRIIGRPLEAALVRAAGKYQIFINNRGDNIEILDRHPFSSEDKFSATHLKKDRKTFWNYLGAPEILLEKSNLGAQEKSNLLLEIDNLAFSGYRVLGVMKDNNFLGLLAFNDPVRPTVKESISKMIKAGVKTSILTGDHKGTGLSVANEVGLGVKDNQLVTGAELKKIDDRTLSARLESIKVFARVTPEDKLRIVRLYKEKGEVVAMTGDGVNDAPALKEADIGIAVGSGTDVAKGAADLIILDDNFDTIVSAIEEGRRTLENIKKVIVYLFSNVFDGLVLIGGSILAGVALPLNALQILWVNFFLDSFPAIALAFENGIDHLEEKPIRLRNRLLDPTMRFLILVVGAVTSFLLLFMYIGLIRFGFDEATVRTFIFASFSLYTLFLVFSVRSLKMSIWNYNIFSNQYLVGSVLIGFILTIAAVYLPFFQNLFGTVSLSWPWMAGVVAFGFVNIVAVEFGKWIFRKNE